MIRIKIINSKKIIVKKSLWLHSGSWGVGAESVSSVGVGRAQERRERNWETERMLVCTEAIMVANATKHMDFRHVLELTSARLEN